MKAILTVGIPASGKSTWTQEYCRKNGAINTNRDDIRFSLTGTEGWSQYKFKKSIESLVTEIQYNTILLAADKGRDVVVSDTNLNPIYRKKLTDFCKGLGYEVIEKVFHVSYEEAIKRDSARDNGVGPHVIYTMHQKYLEYIGRNTYTPNTNLPDAVLFDLDGTLADMSGIRNPFDWEKVGLDKPRDVVIEMARGYHAVGYAVIVLSGRDGICYDDSKAWLIENEVPHDSLLMREAGDNRKDSVIKEEIFWRDIAPHFNVCASVDDRPVMIRMWHELKIPNVICVGNPWTEF